MEWNTKLFLESLDDQRLLQVHKLLNDILNETPDTLSYEFQLAAHLESEVHAWMKGVEPLPESEMSLHSDVIRLDS